MKNIFSSRRNKSPHDNEEAEKKEGTFFSKESKKPFFKNSKNPAVQTKLTVGQRGDKYENFLLAHFSLPPSYFVRL